MTQAARLVWDVIDYRIKHFEMAHFPAAFLLMVALHTPFFHILVRTFFALLLNLLMYFINDFYDIERDLNADREPDKTIFLANHRSSARISLVGLSLILGTVSIIYDLELLVPLVIAGGVCWLYSKLLKNVPFTDVPAMIVCGTFLLVIAFPLDHWIGWLLALQVGLITGVSQIIQSLRDYKEDRTNDRTSTVVFLQKDYSLLLARGLMLLASLYGFLFLHYGFGLLMLVTVLVPYTPGEVQKYWNRIRFLFGTSWVGILGWIYFKGSPLGILRYVS